MNRKCHAVLRAANTDGFPALFHAAVKQEPEIRLQSLKKFELACAWLSNCALLSLHIICSGVHEVVVTEGLR